MALALDGTDTGNSTASTTVAGLNGITTTGTNRIIVALVTTQDASGSSIASTVSGVSGGSLSWTKRISTGSLAMRTVIRGNVEIWWALAATALSSAVVTATLQTNTANNTANICVFAVSGANTTTPFDVNVSLPASTNNTTAGATPSVSGVSTTNANTLLFSACQCIGTGNPGSTFATIDTTNFGGSGGDNESKIVSATQASVSVAFGATDAGNGFVIVADAIQALATALWVDTIAPTIRRPHLMAAAAMFASGGVTPEGVYQFWRNRGWEQPQEEVQLRIPPTRRGAILRGDDGNQGIYQFWQNRGWEQQPEDLQLRVPPTRRGSILRGDDGNQGVYQFWRNAGWEVQTFQPPHPRPERFGAIAPRDDGIQGIYRYWQNAGWEVQPPQPPHPRPERAGAIQPWVTIEAQFVNWVNAGWEAQPPQPPHPRRERSGAIAPKDDGTEAVYVAWQNAGWEVQPPQPPHPRPERTASWLRGDDGNEAPFIFVPPTAGWGFEAIPAHLRIRVKQLVPWDDGNQAPFVAWHNTGWETQPVQPPHPRPEKSAALVPADPGNQAPFVNWRNFGWEIQPVQPPHPRPERGSGVLARGDDGTQAQYSPFVAYAYDQQFTFRHKVWSVVTRAPDDDWLSGGIVPPPPVIIPGPVPGTGDEIRPYAEEARRKWLRWAEERRRRRQHQQAGEAQDIAAEPPPAELVSELSLLERNLKAIRSQQSLDQFAAADREALQQAITAIALARQMDEEDVEILLLLG